MHVSQQILNGMTKLLNISRLHFLALFCLGSFPVSVLACEKVYFAPEDASHQHPLAQPHPLLVKSYQLARAGNAAEQMNMAVNFNTGHLIAACPEKALYWYQQAAGNGNSSAREWLATHESAQPAQPQVEQAVAQAQSESLSSNDTARHGPEAIKGEQRMSPVVLLPGVSPAFVQTWSFDKLAQQALLTHPAILGKRSSSEAALADVEGAKWQRFPTPGVTMSRDGQGNPNSLVTLQQPLWAGGRIDSGIDAAQHRYTASEKAISESQQVVLGQIINAYAEALRWQGKKAIGERTVAQQQQLLEMINRRVNADASPAVDMQLAQSRLYQANNDLSAATQSLTNALTQLSQLAGRQVSEVLPVDLEKVVVPNSLDAALEQAREQSPVLARLAFEEVAAGSDIDVQRAALWPKISMRYEHQQANLPFSVGYQRVMVVADSQIGAGLSAEAGIGAANGRHEAAIQARESAIRDLQQQVSIDWYNLTTSRLQYGNAAKASSNSREVFNSYTRQYTAGRKSWLDVMNAVREASQYELLVLDANAQMLGSALRLSLWTGKLNPLTSN